MDLNRGRFLQNGRSGYVLKPAVLREGNNFMFSFRRQFFSPGLTVLSMFVVHYEKKHFLFILIWLSSFVHR